MAPTLTSQTTGFGERPAILVVDASRGFTDPDSPLGAAFGAEIARINELLAYGHQRHWPVFLSTVVYRDAHTAHVFRTKLPDLNVLTPESPWVTIDPRLDLADSDRIFEKAHASCFHGTPLADWLRDADVDTVIVAGFTTSGCVRATAVDALQNEFRVIVARDAVGDRDPAAHDANLKDLAIKYADVLSAREIIEGDREPGSKGSAHRGS